MPAYYLYENWFRGRARVHRDGCGHVNMDRVMDGIEWEFDRWVNLGEFESPRGGIH